MPKVTCWRCGNETIRKCEYQERYFCADCRAKHDVDHKRLASEYAELKIKLMYERAMVSLERNGVYMREYKDACEKILNAALDDTEKFFSSDEMIAAIMLLQYGYQLGINYKV